jgi:hypothetical protein
MAHAEFNRHPTRLLRGEILGRWGQLTASDIEDCDRFQLITVLQSRYGYARRRAEKEVELFFGEFQERLRMAA